MVSSLVSMVIAFLRLFCICDHFRKGSSLKVETNSIIIVFYLNLKIWFSCLKTWVNVSWEGACLCFSFQLQKRGINDKGEGGYLCQT